MYKWKPDMWLRLEYFILQPVFKKEDNYELKKEDLYSLNDSICYWIYNMCRPFYP